METLQARIASFAKSSKRTKQSLNKSTSSALKWPHPATYKATPNTLAEAGFYYDPSAEYRDNVTCFMCDKQLAGWEKVDDPFAIHWDKCTSSCPWAMVRCSLRLDLDEDGSYHFANAARLPSSRAMEKARLESYTMHKSWPHDTVKGHGANSKKMAKAGFVYTPQSVGDDTATCFYCGISLSGWDDDDDPLEEHRKREERTRIPCPFFASSAMSALPLSKSTSKPPSRITSKPHSRVASQSKISKATFADEGESEGGSSNPDEPPAPQSKTRGSTRGKKAAANGSSSTPAASTASRRSTRSKSTRGKTVESRESGEESGAEGSGNEAGKKVSKTKRKGKATGKLRMESVQEEDKADGDEDEEMQEDEAEPVKPKRGCQPSSKKVGSSTSKTKKSPSEAGNDALEIELPTRPPKATHTRTRSKANLQPDTPSEAPSPIASKPAPKGRMVSRSKAKPKVFESGSDVAESGLSRMERKTNEQRSASSIRRAPQTGEMEAFVGDASSLHQTKMRRSSMTSDDAGYATAELPMDVDEEKSGLPGSPIQASSSRTSSHAGKAMEVDLDDTERRDGDVVMAEGQDRDSGLAETGTAGPTRHSSRKDSPVGRSWSNTSSNKGSDYSPTLPTSSSKPHLESGRIAGDGRQQQQSAPSAAASAYQPALLPNFHKGKAKMQVEVIIPTKKTVRVVADVDTMEYGQPPMSESEVEGTHPESHDDVVPSGADDSEEPSDHFATPPPVTSSSSPSRPVQPSTPTMKTVQFLSTESAPPAPSDSAVPDSMIPLLSMMPMEKLTSLTEDESVMTIEQYIRREIEIQYQRFKEDGEQRIALFKAKAAETRRIIEAS